MYIAAGFPLMIAASCAVLEQGVVENTPTNKVESRGFDSPNDSITSENGFISNILNSGNDTQADGLPVNKFLWRASLDTLSFLPLASTDPFSGIITTEWGASPATPDERVRVTARIDGKELTARALSVSVFRETLSESGAWISASVNPQTSQQVKDKILLRARELRVVELDGSSL